MKRFEYRLVPYADIIGDLTGHLSAWGADGWRLVGETVVPSGADGARYFIFMREIAVARPPLLKLSPDAKPYSLEELAAWVKYDQFGFDGPEYVERFLATIAQMTVIE